MKKITLFFVFAVIGAFSFSSYAQTLNQAASWPNAGWTLSGTYTAGGLLSDPTVAGTTFNFDDDAAGSSSADTIIATSPVIDLTAASVAGETWVTVSGDYVYRAFGGDVLAIETYDADAMTWSALETFVGNSTNSDYLTCANTAAYTTAVLDISGFTATQLSGFQYRFSYDDQADWQYGWCLTSPTITSAAPPACPDPSALTTTNISTTGADLGWTENGTASAWNVEIVDVTAGGIVTGTATDIGVSNPFSVSGLTPNNDYEFYVQADCGSAWVGPFAFSTPCNVISSFPYTDGFENTGTISNCWSQEYVSASVNWTFTNVNGNGSVSPQTDNYMAVFRSNNYNSNATKLVMPTFDLTGLTDPALKFSYTQVDWSGDQDKLRVYYKTSAAGSWTLLSEYISSVTSWTDVILQLPNASSDYYIAFEATSGYGYGVTLDDVVVNNITSLGVDEFSYSSFTYYPNPVNNNLTLSAKKEINNVSVYNMVGQEVYRSTPNTMTSVVDMSGLQAGAYFVKVTVGNAIKTVKVIKN